MLYKQLQRISQLDEQINDLHLRLADYYHERASILTDTPAASPTPTTDVTIRPTDTRVLYAELKDFWRTIGITLPPYETLKKGLELVTEAIGIFENKNPEFIGHLKVVAVPPQKQLDKVIENSEQLAKRYNFTDEVLKDNIKKRSKWSLVILTSPTLRHAVSPASDPHEIEKLSYDQLNPRGLGIREVVAADISGFPLLSNDEWVLLLKDSGDKDYIPCVTMKDDRVIFDIEDSHFLLGNNYIQPTLALG